MKLSIKTSIAFFILFFHISETFAQNIDQILDFFQKLNTCTKYNLELKGEDSETESFTKLNILGLTKDKKICEIIIITSAAEKTNLANAYNSELCKFPSNILKEIKSNNFYQYREKFCKDAS